jgi:hypothetical protein
VDGLIGDFTVSGPHEKMAALRLAALHPADRAWVLRQLAPLKAARLRVLLTDPTLRAAAMAGITVDDLRRPVHPTVAAEEAASEPVVDALGEHVAGWHPDWASLVRSEDGLPPALAESLRAYRADAVREPA